MDKIGYKKSYDLNMKYIKEEIQKCSDHPGYVSEAMKQADEKRHDKKKVRLQKRQATK